MFGFTQSNHEFNKKRHEFTSKEQGYRNVTVFVNGHDAMDEQEQQEAEERALEVNNRMREKLRKRNENMRLAMINESAEEEGEHDNTYRTGNLNNQEIQTKGIEMKHQINYFTNNHIIKGTNDNLNDSYLNQSDQTKFKDNFYLNSLNNQMSEKLLVNSSIISRAENQSHKNGSIKINRKNENNLSYSNQNQHSFTNKLNFTSSNLIHDRTMNQPEKILFSQSSISANNSQVNILQSQNISQNRKADIILPFDKKKRAKEKNKKPSKKNGRTKTQTQSSTNDSESDEIFFDDFEEDLVDNLNANTNDKYLTDKYFSDNNTILNIVDTYNNNCDNLVSNFNSFKEISQPLIQGYFKSESSEIIFDGMMNLKGKTAFKFHFSNCKLKKFHIMYYGQEFKYSIENLSLNQKCLVKNQKMYEINSDSSDCIGIYILLGI